jgi:hypothetical protein
MIRVAIGGSDVDIAEASPEWINQQINRRRADGVAVCVRVAINQADINVGLTTPTCGGGGGGRAPNERERRIMELWNERGLNQNDFSGGNLVAFLRQLQRLL